MTAPTAAPVYAQIQARVPYRWGDRKLEAGEAIVGLRFASVEDRKVFRDSLRWSAFQIVDLAEAPAAAATAMTVADTAPSLRGLAEQLAGLAAADLEAIPGISKKAVASLKEWAAGQLATPAGTPA